MFKYIFRTGLLIILLVDLSFAITGREIIEESDSLPKANSSSILFTMNIHKAGRIVEKQFKMEMVTIDESERRSLIIFSRPSLLKLLTYNYTNKPDCQWLAMSSGKVKRITEAAKRKSFANSHFSYSELLLQNIDDFEYRYLGEGIVDSELCYMVECIEKENNSNKTAYSTQVLYPRLNDAFIKKIEFFERGILVKYLVNYDIEEVDGSLAPMKIVMYDAQSNDKTELVTTKIHNNIKINKAKFNREAIKYNK